MLVQSAPVTLTGGPVCPGIAGRRRATPPQFENRCAYRCVVQRQLRKDGNNCREPVSWKIPCGAFQKSTMSNQVFDAAIRGLRFYNARSPHQGAPPARANGGVAPRRHRWISCRMSYLMPRTVSDDNKFHDCSAAPSKSASRAHRVLVFSDASTAVDMTLRLDDARASPTCPQAAAAATPCLMC
jgi:hypothetical protein